MSVYTRGKGYVWDSRYWYLIPCRSIPIYRYLGECTLPGNLFSLFLHLKWADKNSYGYSMRGRCCWSCSRPMRAKACIPIPMSTIVTSRRTMQIPLCDLPFPFLLVYPFYRLGPRQWVPFAGNLFPAGVLRSGNRCDIGLAAPCAACNRVDKFVPEPFVSGTIRPHVPSGAAKHRFHRVFSLIGRITGRCPCLAKTDPFYILKHRIILCIHLGA